MLHFNPRPERKPLSTLFSKSSPKRLNSARHLTGSHFAAFIMAWFTSNDGLCTTYKAVRQDEHGQFPNTRQPSNRRWHILASSVVLLASLIGLMFYTSSRYHKTVAHTPVTTSEVSCGFLVQEALDRGCHFDLMSFSWLPDECYDRELIQEFESLQQWHWYGDPEGKHEISKSQVLLGEAEALFVSFEYHKAHCVFMWEKLHRAFERGAFVDSYIGNYNHTMHCGHMLLMNVEDSQSLNTQILRKFPNCGPAAT